MNVTDLKNLAKSLNVKGYSKLRKAELILAIGDACYDDAVAENRARKVRAIVAGYKVSSYNERMVNRLFGYHAQNGHAHKLTLTSELSYDSPAMLDTLTAKQRRRVAKKTGRQYGKLVSRVTR